MSILVSSLLWIVMKVYLWIMAQNKASLYFTSLVSDELYNTQGTEGGQHNLISSWYLKCNHSQMGIRHYLSLWRLNMGNNFSSNFFQVHIIFWDSSRKNCSKSLAHHGRSFMNGPLLIIYYFAFYHNSISVPNQSLSMEYPSPPCCVLHSNSYSKAELTLISSGKAFGENQMEEHCCPFTL